MREMLLRENIDINLLFYYNFYNCVTFYEMQ